MVRDADRGRRRPRGAHVDRVPGACTATAPSTSWSPKATVETDDEGRPVALVGYCQDVTDQRRAELTIREAEIHYRSLFEQSPVSIWEEDFSAVRAWLTAVESTG